MPAYDDASTAFDWSTDWFDIDNMRTLHYDQRSSTGSQSCGIAFDRNDNRATLTSSLRFTGNKLR